MGRSSCGQPISCAASDLSDPATGEQKWVYDPKVWEGNRPGNLGFNTRGLSYWTDGKGDNRIMENTMTGFKHLFGSKNPLVTEIRNIGLSLVDQAPAIKHLFVRQAVGKL